jgi:hypothetical protein
MASGGFPDGFGIAPGLAAGRLAIGSVSPSIRSLGDATRRRDVTLARHS